MNEFRVQSYTLKELAEHYRCSAKTFKKWLAHIQQDLGPRIGHFYNPRQVRIIVDRLGAPFVWLFGLCMKVLPGVLLGDGGDHDGGGEGNNNDHQNNHNQKHTE